MVLDKSEYYFETSEQLYDGEVKAKVQSRLYAPTAPSSPLITDSDGNWAREHHAVLFSKDGMWNYVDCELLPESVTLPIPTCLNGYEVSRDWVEPSIDLQQVFSGSDNTLEWNIETTSEPTF